MLPFLNVRERMSMNLIEGRWSVFSADPRHISKVPAGADLRRMTCPDEWCPTTTDERIRVAGVTAKLTCGGFGGESPIGFLRRVWNSSFRHTLVYGICTVYVSRRLMDSYEQELIVPHRFVETAYMSSGFRSLRFHGTALLEYPMLDTWGLDIAIVKEKE